eukprot:TRINITY_DN27814_c0_g1_i1.p1 TRINITY_DN27814_c0_g1~~TRINITY_DN27814_c0_g1_i1.p1  ORF type:complete len:142 (+),score=5.36 TRINITY_DN27814_c0_g1_i1:38-463(+)
MNTLRGVVLTAALGGVLGCQSRNQNLVDLGFQACYLVDTSNVATCSCPFETCSYSAESFVGECEETTTGTLLGVGSIVGAVLLCCFISWMLCCRGQGCSVTAPCQGGYCFSSRLPSLASPDEKRNIPQHKSAIPPTHVGGS